MFVTGLEFLPVLTENHTSFSVAEAAVLSISIDNHVCIHTLPYRSKCGEFSSDFDVNCVFFTLSETIPAWLGILILIFTLFMTFVFCSYLGL